MAAASALSDSPDVQAVPVPWPRRRPRGGLLAALALAAALATAAPPARAGAPRHLVAQGQLADATGAPIAGTVLLTFTIYASALADAPALWTETQSVTVTAGLFTATLGALVPLDPAALRDVTDAHLGLAVAPDGELGRTPLASAAYAFFADRADRAATLGGLAAAAFAQSGHACPAGERMAGVLADGLPSCLPDRDTTYSGVDFAVSGQTCPAGQLVLGVDASGALLCTPDRDTLYDGADFTLSGASCPAGQRARAVDAAGHLLCAADQDTTYSGADFARSGQAGAGGTGARGFHAAGGLLCAADANTLYSGAHFATSSQTCPAGQLAQGFSAAGALLCVPDADTNTTYGGANFALSNQSCAANAVVTAIGAAGTPTCQSTAAWDTNAANDLTTATVFGGAVTGTSGALSFPDASISAAKLAESYLNAAGDSVTGTLTASAVGTTIELGHTGGVDFGAGCGSWRHYPTGWARDPGTSDGFCITTGQNPSVADDETLFITAQDNGAANEAIYFGSSFDWSHNPPTTTAACWRGMRVRADGVAELYGALTSSAGALYADLAEHLPVAGGYEVGDVISVVRVDKADFGRSRFVRASTPYDRAVVGVVSDTAALAMGPPEGRAPVALAGLVKVKVDARYGPIRKGAVLVASATPGHAMAAAQDVPGAGLGKALEDHDRGRGLVMMMVAPR